VPVTLGPASQCARVHSGPDDPLLAGRMGQMRGRAVLGSELPANRHLLGARGGTGGGTVRAHPVTPDRRGEELRVVELRLVGEDVRVRVRRHGEVALTDLLADPSPRDALRVEERDPPVTQVVR
jgi:hypothetical protein